ncbi:ATP-binding protein [Pseudomonas syringae pv. tomato]|uniref:AAA family ATPase n=1 Tax=Pseudomonas syringae group genomosp. 3 TaxID=251701 RepID=UPI0022A6C3EF|nr:ATP-binding protein [Pseudomonas syringae group genomosp. 3]MCZ0950212.1 ATP-binding protein [Pseudomonas syringae pv. tomato]
MLIEFSVANFHSFRDRQTFSMVAAPRLMKKNNVFHPNLKGDKVPGLLKVAAIYGPNASGKSSLVNAFNIVARILRDNKSKILPVDPFRFDPSLANKPSEFEYHFITNGVRYQFSLAATKERIIKEMLIAYPKGNESLLYSREYLPSGEKYIFGEDLEGGDVVHEAWKRLTSPTTLFIMQAVENSSEELDQLGIPLRWFGPQSNTILQNGMVQWAAFSKTILKQSGGIESNLQEFLQQIDVPITSIRLEEKDPTWVLDADLSFQERHAAIQKNVRTILTHETALGKAEFDFSEESGGTKNLMGFWVPWVLLTMKNSDSLLMVDELDSSLHPKIVEDLVKRHVESKSNSQLIFTTHDTHLMNTKKMRRDQFWVTERDANGATILRSVHDYEGREGENIEKRYYEGRYRGLPILRT